MDRIAANLRSLLATMRRDGFSFASNMKTIYTPLGRVDRAYCLLAQEPVRPRNPNCCDSLIEAIICLYCAVNARFWLMGYTTSAMTHRERREKNERCKYRLCPIISQTAMYQVAVKSVRTLWIECRPLFVEIFTPTSWSPIIGVF